MSEKKPEADENTEKSDKSQELPDQALDKVTGGALRRAILDQPASPTSPTSPSPI
jgi:hypothetical protein